MEDNKEVILLCHSYLERLIVGLYDRLERLSRKEQNVFGDIPDVLEGLLWLTISVNQTEVDHGFHINPALMNELSGRLVRAVAGDDFDQTSAIVGLEILPVLSDCYDVIDEYLK